MQKCETAVQRISKIIKDAVYTMKQEVQSYSRSRITKKSVRLVCCVIIAVGAFLN